MMTQKAPPPKLATQSDPYRMRTLEQILTLFDRGQFLQEVMEGHRDLQKALLDHKAEHGPKGCKGSMTITVNYALGKSGDVSMGASVKFTTPNKPPASAAAFINDDGELTLYSPMLAQMHGAPRDVTSYDPDTGEIIDPT